MRTIIAIILIFSGIGICYAEEIELSPIIVNLDGTNQTDALNRKEGPWVENYGCLNFYVAGNIDGVLMWYDASSSYNKWHGFLSASDGVQYGIDVMTGESDEICTVVNHIGPNTDFKYEDTTSINLSLYKWQGYYYEYNEYGQLEAEGWMIWHEHWVVDNEHVGIWKYYDSDGNITYKDMGEYWRQRFADDKLEALPAITR